MVQRCVLDRGALDDWSDRSLSSIWQRLIAYLLLAALLVVGGWYWHLKLRQMRDGLPIERHLRHFATIERLAVAALALGSLALTASWVWAVGTLADRAWATGFIVFAWAEYVNYFRVQLMHDTTKDLRRLFRTRRLRRSALAVDLARRGPADEVRADSEPVDLVDQPNMKATTSARSTQARTPFHNG